VKQRILGGKDKSLKVRETGHSKSGKQYTDGGFGIRIFNEEVGKGRRGEAYPAGCRNVEIPFIPVSL
jgi:hypothetical protein